MSRKPHSTAITATVSLSVPSGLFGATVVASISGAVPPNSFVHYICQAATGGLQGWAPIVGGQASLTFGPTQTWSSGGASGTAYVVTYDTTPNTDLLETVISDAASFTVSP